MKKPTKGLIQLSVLGVLGLGVILTLILPELPTGQTKQGVIEISIFVDERDMALYTNTRLGMEAAAMDFGAELRFITPGEEDHDTQLENILREVEGGAQALVVAPVDAQALGVALTDVEIPVITMESEMEGSQLVISPDNQAVGMQLAQAVMEDLPQGSTVLVLDTAGQRTGLQQRLDGCVAALEGAGYTVVLASLQEGESQKLQVEAVVAVDDETTLTVAQWQFDQEARPALYGVGGTSEIAAYLEQGILRATVGWSDYAAGYLAVQQGAAAATGQGVDDSHTLVITTIRGETIYDPDNQKLLFPVV